MALLAYWPLKVDFNDYSGNGQHVTPYQTAPTKEDDALMGTVYRFAPNHNNQIYNWLRRTDSSFLRSQLEGKSTFAVSCWVKSPGVPAGTGLDYENGILSITYGFVLLWLNSGYIHLRNSFKLTYPLALDNMWHHICFTTNSNNLILYVDNIQVQTLPITTTLSFAWNNEVSIGTDNNYGIVHGFTGNIAEMRIYNHSLTDAERNDIYSKTKAPFININNISSNRISNKTGKDMSIVSFTANQPLQEWTARAGGFSPTTGSLVGQGTALAQGATAQFEIENEELFNGDGDYRINIYGKNSAGVWTPYE